MEPASTYLHAELAHKADGPVRETLRWVGTILGGIFETGAPAMVDLVVRRIDTDAEVLRITLDNTDEADFTLDAVNHDLGRLSVYDFVKEWTPSPGDGAGADTA